jgi:hypothetical protein
VAKINNEPIDVFRDREITKAISYIKSMPIDNTITLDLRESLFSYTASELFSAILGKIKCHPKVTHVYFILDDHHPDIKMILHCFSLCLGRKEKISSLQDLKTYFRTTYSVHFDIKLEQPETNSAKYNRI